MTCLNTLNFWRGLIFLLVVSQVCVNCEILLSPQVTTPDGILLGEIGLSNYDREFYKFWCIPFGKSERYEAAVPPDPWTGVRDATSCSTRCVQFPMADNGGFDDFFEGSEDCLVLNVFAPKLTATEKEKLPPLPVLVFIHGGYFQMGSGLEYSGELFMDENIIVVTINYRLGAFGFLTTGDGVIEGSLGMKDQVLALKWVQRNIKYFGGDPRKVTIEGESAGAGSVSLLVLSPMAKGLSLKKLIEIIPIKRLFVGAIAQSGSALCPWSYQSRPEEVFDKFASTLNCSLATTEESKACLKNVSSEDTRNACRKTKLLAELEHPLFPAVEVVAPKNPKSAKFLPDHPLRMMEQGNFNRVPFIIGVNEDEGAYQGGLFVNDVDLMEDLNENWLAKGGIILGVDTRNISKHNVKTGLRKLRRFYFGDEDVVPNQDSLQKYAPLYTYLFTKKGGLRLAEMMGWFDRPVTSHGDELQYLFFKGAASDKADRDFSKVFLKLWVSFFYFGKPTNTWGSAKSWPYVDPENGPIKVYRIDEDTELLDDPFKDRLDVWESLTENEWSEYKSPSSEL